MSNSIVRRGSRNGHCEQVQYDDVQAYVPPDRQGSKDDLRSATNPYYGKTESLHYDHEETLLWKDHVKERYLLPDFVDGLHCTVLILYQQV